MRDWGNFAELVTALATVSAVIVASRAIIAKSKDDRRADRLDRINRQLSQLYGKLLILNEAGGRNWQSFVGQHGNDLEELGRDFRRFFPYNLKEEEPITVFNPPAPNAQQLTAYRKWLKTLFIRTNEEMSAVIYANADLVVGRNMPQVLVNFAEHVASLKLLLLKIEEEEKLEKKLSKKSTFLADWKEYVKLMAPHPAGMGYYINAAFEVLKEEQERLLSTYNKPFTEKEIADKIKMRQWEIEDHWCMREHAVRAAAGQPYSYKPVPKPVL